MKKVSLIKLVKLVFCVAAFCMLMVGARPEPAKADSKIRNLEANKAYKIDLDEDGKKESISYKLTMGKDDYATFKILINGKTKATAKGLYSAYEPHMQITDIDTKDGAMDIWVYCLGGSDDLMFSALYQYKDGKMKKLFSSQDMEPDAEYFLGVGVLYKATGDGKFYVLQDQAFFVEVLIGNHSDIIPFQLKNGKVSQVKTNTYSVYEIYNKNNQLTVAKKTVFYKKPDKSKGSAFTLKKGDKVKPVSIYCSGKDLYVKFKNAKGKYGWLRVEDYGFGNAAFSDVILAG